MTLGYAEAVQNARLDAITARAGNGALLRIYNGTRPAKGGTPTTLLAELTCGSPFAPAASGGVLTANAFTADLSANATGTATWFRVVKSDGSTHVLDGSAGVSGTDLILSSVSIVAGELASVSSLIITAGNN